MLLKPNEMTEEAQRMDQEANLSKALLVARTEPGVSIERIARIIVDQFDDSEVHLLQTYLNEEYEKRYQP